VAYPQKYYFYPSFSNPCVPMALANTESCLIRHGDLVWNLYQHTLIPAVPPHLPAGLTPGEAKELLRKYRPFFIRWTSGWDLPEDTGFWYVIKDSPEDPAGYSPKIRSTIRKGMAHFEARIIDAGFLKDRGYPVYLSAFSRYRSHPDPMPEAEFREQIDGLFRFGEWEFWGVFETVTGTLAGYSMNWIYDRCCEYKSIKLDPRYMQDSSGYLLIYEMNRHYLNGLGFRYVNDGSRSLLHDSGIQDFLEKKFQFRKAYCRMHIRYRPLVAAAVAVLYPFRRILFPVGHPLFRKISVLLKHEEIARASRSIA